MRVLEDEICYRAKECKFLCQEVLKIFFYVVIIVLLHVKIINLVDLTVYKLFATRADLYRTVYTHAKVKV